MSSMSIPQTNAGSEARPETRSTGGTIYGRLFARLYDGAMKQLEREVARNCGTTSWLKRQDEHSSLEPAPDSTSSTTRRPSASSR